jgi:hypothetical protein
VLTLTPPLDEIDDRRGFTIPTNENLLPPGFYMIYLVTADGAPSAPRWIRVLGQ